MSKALLILIVALVVGIVWYGFSSLNQKTTTLKAQPTISTSLIVDKTAKFAIYTHGTLRVFTASMYHNLSEDVYISSESPNVVRIKKAGISWDDFFQTLPFNLTKNCLTTGTGETFCTNQKGTLKFYLNGVKADDFLTREIEQGDKALITYGYENDDQIREQINQLDN